MIFCGCGFRRVFHVFWKGYGVGKVFLWLSMGERKGLPASECPAKVIVHPRNEDFEVWKPLVLILVLQEN